MYEFTRRRDGPLVVYVEDTGGSLRSVPAQCYCYSILELITLHSLAHSQDTYSYQQRYSW